MTIRTGTKARAVDLSCPSPTADGGRLAFIDGLRGLAALYVLMFHQLGILNMTTGSAKWEPPLLISGRSGVTLFFVVSAFSLCHAHREGFSRPGTLWLFYLRRAARILPLFYAMLAVTLIRNRWFTHWPISGRQVFRAVLVLFNVVPGDEGGIVPGAWTIGTEMLFYAVFPFVFGRMRSLSGIAAACLAALLASLVFHLFVLGLPMPPVAQTSFFNCSFLRHLPVFLLGMGVWMLFDRNIQGGRMSPAQGALLILGSLWAYYAYVHGLLNVLFPDPYYWEAIIFAALLLGLGILPTRLLVNPATLFCGRISYSLYLLHPTIIIGLQPFYRIANAWHCSNIVRYLTCLVVTLACVLPLASLSYRCIERPGMRFGNRVISRMTHA